MQHKSKSHQSLEKALIILLAFQRQNHEMGTVEIGSKLGFHKSTVSRMVKVLTAYRFLQQNPQTRKFSLGPSISRLSRSLNQSLQTNMVHIAKPFKDEMRDRIKETVIFEVLSGESMVMAYVAEGPRMVRLAGNIGDRVPSHAASGSKAFLAFSPPEVREAVLGKKLRRFTQNTITEFEKLHEHFEKIRRDGFAFDDEEIDEGTRAVGAPVFNHENRPVAAVIIAGPAQSITGNADSPIVLALKETAKQLSEQFFHVGDNLDIVPGAD
jgi:DNA-binding IclR family transcriptional regulator